MDKLILIDGNSLLNRAFYAMSVFSTRDGLPTNGIFGFTKLLLKIINDESPKYLAVAFDLHAPTFRHKMYDGYKATRKPMPEELVKQVPVLKELLRAMRICCVELEGYEADDVIGTLSRKFGDVEVHIYTGDRDAYQLVRENVEVCFTKRGVTDLDRLTAANFRDKVGLVPAQIIEEKALMGDSSDNIPGVKGVGPKSALTLLQTYGDLDGVYAHIGELSAGLRQKLESDRPMAYLSRQLATIDCAVPLSTELADCALHLPFPVAARDQFRKLEFRSMLNSDIFGEEPPKPAVSVAAECTAEGLPDLLKEAAECTRFGFCIEDGAAYLSLDGKNYILRLRQDFLSPGFFTEELSPLFSILFGGNKTAVVDDCKALAHELDGIGQHLACPVEDVTLLRYLSDSNVRQASPKELAGELSLPEENRAEALLKVCDERLGKLKGTPEETLYRDLELPLARVLFDMERTGVAVDLSRFPEFSDKYKRELKELSARIFELAGTQFNLNSPFQLSEVLFERLGYDPKGAKKNVKGGYSTGADILEKLAEEHEIARLILRYRELQKLLSTYIDGIRPLAAGGIVHTTYNQSVTTTGRLSSANPNLQNIPVRTDEGRELRKLFIAREGDLLVDADYSQIELRLLAHFSGCKVLVEAYRAGEDIHAATASHIFSKPLNEVTPAMRRRAKTINFGIIYGMSAFGLSKDLGCSSAEAQEYIGKYFATHPEVREYMDANVKKAKENGYVTTILGRKRYIPEIYSSNYNLRAFGERAAMNMPLQGSAADIIKIAMLRVHDRLKREGMKSKMVLQVHDELILNAPAEECIRAAALLKEEMEGAVRLDVPLIAEVSTGKSWYEAK